MSHDEPASRQLGDLDHFLEEGIPVTSRATTNRPVQLKVAVTDAAAAVAFYREAFSFRYEVTRRTEDEDVSSFIFGRYGEPDFMLLHLIDDPQELDRPGRSTFGLLVDDLDAVHQRAVSCGATEVVAPHDPQGMPRCSAVKDPDDNWVWLYQG